MARWRGRLRRHRLVAAHHLGDLEPDRVHRVERRHRLLEDDRRLAPAHLAQRALVDADELAAAELDRAAHVRVLRQQAHQRHRRRRLARTRLADDRQHLAGVEVERGADHGRVPRAVDPEVDVEVARPAAPGRRSSSSIVTGVRSLRGRRAATMAVVQHVFRPTFGRVLTIGHRPCWLRRRRRGLVVAATRVERCRASPRGWRWSSAARAGRCSGARASWSTTAACASSTCSARSTCRGRRSSAVDTKWALTLITAYGRFTAWAAPAPGASRGRARAPAERRRRTCPRARRRAAGIRPGDLPSSPSGSAALLIRAPLGGAARRRPPRRPAARARAGARSRWHVGTLIGRRVLLGRSPSRSALVV